MAALITFLASFFIVMKLSIIMDRYQIGIFLQVVINLVIMIGIDRYRIWAHTPTPVKENEEE